MGSGSTPPGWASAPAIAAVLVLFGGALVGIVVTSLAPDPLGGPLTLSAWRSLLSDPAFGRAIRFTGAVTVASTLVSVVVAITVAASVRDRPWARRLATLPVLVPHLLVATVTVVWLGPGGLADRLVGGLPVEIVRSRAGIGIVLVYVLKEAPFLTLLLLAAWDDALADRLEAATVHGAGPVRRLRHVAVPALRGSLLVGGLVVSAFVVGAFDVPLVVGPTAPDVVATYALRATRVADLSGQAVAAGALLVATAASLLLAGLAGWLWERGRD